MAARPGVCQFWAVVTTLADALSPDNIDRAIELARSPMEVRGFGVVKAAAAAALLGKLVDPAR